MELFLLKFSACLLVFWLTYVLLLEKQQMHHFKRFYLLVSFAIALIIPQLTIIEYIEPIVQNFEITTAFIPIDAEVIPQPIETTPVLTLETILWSIYILGATLFVIRFAVNLFRLYGQIATNDKQRNRNFIYVLLKTYRIPHSFFKYIFVNQQQFENNQIPEEVRLHEETHAKQWHSLDILLLELFQIVFWFHPLVYILKHHVKLNHEFLADDAVLQQGVTTKSYQNILLQFSSNTHNHQLASAINYSSFKKRFTVMKTQTSKTRIWLSTLLVLPILAILFYSFAEREYVEKDKTENPISETNSFLVFVEKTGNTLELRCENGCRWSHLVLETNSKPYIINDFGFSEGNTLDTDKFAFSIEPNQSGVTLSGLKGTAWVDLAFSLPKNQKQAVNQLGMTNETVPNLEQISDDLQKRAEKNYYKNQFFVVKDKQGRKVSKRFFELDYNNKIKWVYANEIPYHRIDVTEAHFEEAKNSKNYIIKVDGNYISKDDLKKYKASDFITFSYTPISELAEMKEQSVLNLVTPDAYNLFVRLMISHYKQTLEDYENEITLSENKRKINSKELVRTYEFLYYNYKKFTPEIIKHNQLIPPTPIAAKENDWQQVEDILDQKKLTDSEISEYNAWAKNINAKSKKLSNGTTWYPPIDEKELNKLTDIYKKMSSRQKNKAVEFPFPALDVKASQQKATKEQIAEYNTWAKKMNSAIKKAESTKNKRSYPMIKKKEYDKYYKIYRNLMSEAQRENAEPWPNIPPPPPPPPAPEPPKAKKNTEDTPPPPPEPKKPESTLDFIIKMAKANASFYYEGKAITSDEAITLLKKNNQLNVNAYPKSKEGKPIVYISKEPIEIDKKKKSKN
ncbi:M56 family metallopeptidase [Winogradskyella algicola]|uniref:M56 family metallopeptidase n=1 Tax=Winogradskyella algicola TaxID=2575815 RepID=UPI001107AD3E|nr:M56 family metallopeptidase [Winogradskyella algicola]